MSIGSAFAELYEEALVQPEYWAESMSLDFVAALTKEMRDKGISQQELAERVGVSPAYVNKVLRASNNVTLVTVSRFLVALGLAPTLSVKALSAAKNERYESQTDYVSVRNVVHGSRTGPMQVANRVRYHSTEVVTASANDSSMTRAVAVA